MVRKRKGKQKEGESGAQQPQDSKPKEAKVEEQAGPSGDRNVKGQEVRPPDTSSQQRQHTQPAESPIQTIQQEQVGWETVRQRQAPGVQQPQSQGREQGQGQGRDQGQGRGRDQGQGRGRGQGQGRGRDQGHGRGRDQGQGRGRQGQSERGPQIATQQPQAISSSQGGWGQRPQTSPAFQQQMQQPPPGTWGTAQQPQASPPFQQQMHQPPPGARGTAQQPQIPPGFQQQMHLPPGAWGAAQQSQVPPGFQQQMHPPPGAWQQSAALGTAQQPQATPGFQQQMYPPQGPGREQGQGRRPQQGKQIREPQAGTSSQQPVQPQDQRKPEQVYPVSSGTELLPSELPKARQQPGAMGRTPERQSESGEPAGQKQLVKAPISKKEMEEIDKMFQQISVRKRQTGTKCKKQTTVIVNYFPLDTSKLNEAFHYDVAINPDKPKKSLPQVMEQLRLKRYPDRFPAYDGNKNLYTSKPLFDSHGMSDTVSVRVEGDMKEYEVAIKFVSKLDMRALNNSAKYAQNTWHLDPNDPTTPLQCLNVILTNVPPSSYTRIGRSFFTAPRNPISLGEGCILYQGFSQAATLRWQPFVNLDTAHKAFTIAEPVISLLQQMFRNVDLQRGLPPYQEIPLANYIKRLKITYEIQNMKRTYIVNDVNEPAERATFTTDKGNMTVAEYFRNVKHQNLRYPKLPTLWVGNRNRDTKILLPMEFCTLVAGQPVTRTMTSGQTVNMIREVSKDARDRLEKIQRSVDSLQYNTNPVMQEFNLRVSNRAQEVAARILQPPDLEYQNRFRATVQKGTWRSDKFLDPVKIDIWCILCLDQGVHESARIQFGEMLTSLGAESGLRLSKPAYAQKTMRDVRDFFKTAKFQLVVVILNKLDTCYSDVKRASELSSACLTQCVKGTHFWKGIQRATVANILLKINAKLNGQNHRIMQMPQFVTNSTMIMGADVTHPGSQNFPSIAAVTASFDESFFKYRFEWRLQPPRQEMITDLKDITEKHLQFYERERHSKPGRIIYIRDGVSDGQFKEVLNIELRAIRSACRGSHNPQICVILVQKRHRTRFFPKDPRISEDRNGNVPAGTCVDTVITHPTIPDFFLVSHASIKGVARPTKYIKIWDELKMSEDDVEELMYYLCHLYARCNRSVSYPAPTYYAHHAAARAKAYCDRNIDVDRLNDIQSRLQIQPDILRNTPMFFI